MMIYKPSFTACLLRGRARKFYRPNQPTNESAILRRPNRLSARKQTSRETPCGKPLAPGLVTNWINFITSVFSLSPLSFSSVFLPTTAILFLSSFTSSCFLYAVCPAWSQWRTDRLQWKYLQSNLSNRKNFKIQLWWYIDTVGIKKKLGNTINTTIFFF